MERNKGVREPGEEEDRNCQFLYAPETTALTRTRKSWRGMALVFADLGVGVPHSREEPLLLYEKSIPREKCIGEWNGSHRKTHCARHESRQSRRQDECECFAYCTFQQQETVLSRLRAVLDAPMHDGETDVAVYLYNPTLLCK